MPSYEDHDYFYGQKRRNRKRKHSSSTSIYSNKIQSKRRKFPFGKNKFYRRRYGFRNKLVRQKKKKKPPNSANTVHQKIGFDRKYTKGNTSTTVKDVFRLKPQRHTISPEIEAIKNNINHIIAPLSPETSTNANYNLMDIFTTSKSTIILNTTAKSTKNQPFINKRRQSTKNHNMKGFNENKDAQVFDEDTEIRPLTMVEDVKYEEVSHKNMLSKSPSLSKPKLPKRYLKYNSAKRYREKGTRRKKKHRDKLGTYINELLYN